MVIIAYEGKTDKIFLNDVLDNLNLNRAKVRYYNFEGKDNIFNIKHDYYDEIEKDLNKITKILLIVDADNKQDKNPGRGYKNSEDKLTKIIEGLSFDVPIDYYIMCDENKKGTLESFLLSLLKNAEKDCIKKFRDCYSHDLTDKWVYNSFFKHKKHPIDFSHGNFDKLKEKLIKLFENGI